MQKEKKNIKQYVQSSMFKCLICHSNLFNIGIKIICQNNNIYIRGYEKNILNNLITLKILFDKFILKYILSLIVLLIC